MNRTLSSKLIISSILLATITTAAPTAMAGDKHRRHLDNHHTDYAKVTHVEPIYREITHRVPRESCWTESRYRRHDSNGSYTPTILGSVIGGALGNELGHSKKNKQVGAAVGAILGGSIGYDIGRRNNKGGSYSEPYNEQVCETEYTSEYEQKLVGYKVDYRYQGRIYHTRMNKHPGKRIKIAVNVTPVY
jgi:uncharacterized protein YcfJ